MKSIKADSGAIAFCGLYCGGCRKYLKGKCPGCQANEKAKWCKVRTCCMENNYRSCADCTKMDLKDCKYFNNFMASVFGFIFNSDRNACVEHIKTHGYDNFAQYMTDNEIMAMKRK